MRNTTPIAIVIALFIGVVAGFFVGKQKEVTAPTQQQTTAAATPAVDPESERCPMCPCRAWKYGILPAPTWDPKMFDNLTTDFQSKAYLKFNPVEGNRYYVLQYEDANGKVVKTKRVQNNVVLSENHPLPEGKSEGDLWVTVAAANAEEKLGHKSDKIKLRVKAPLSTVAPEILNITVEE